MPSLTDFWKQSFSRYAFIVIDQQKKFCDPLHLQNGTAHTEKVATRNETVIREIRDLGATLFVVYHDDFQEGIETANGGLYKIDVYGTDITVGKNRTSVHEGSNIDNILKQMGKTHLFYFGFNAGACLKNSALSGLFHYRVAVMEDCVGQDQGYERLIPEYLLRMEREGIHRVRSDQAITELYKNRIDIAKAPNQLKRMNPAL